MTEVELEDLKGLAIDLGFVLGVKLPGKRDRHCVWTVWQDGRVIVRYRPELGSWSGMGRSGECHPDEVLSVATMLCGYGYATVSERRLQLAHLADIAGES